MSECIQYVCGKCGNSIKAWSDGNPYFINKRGKKEYAYHPDHDRLSRCIGNDSPALCIACGHEFQIDSRAPISHCPKCESADIVETYELEGRRCPSCKEGVFSSDPNFYCIS